MAALRLSVPCESAVAETTPRGQARATLRSGKSCSPRTSSTSATCRAYTRPAGRIIVCESCNIRLNNLREARQAAALRWACLGQPREDPNRIPCTCCQVASGRGDLSMMRAALLDAGNVCRRTAAQCHRADRICSWSRNCCWRRMCCSGASTQRSARYAKTGVSVCRRPRLRWSCARPRLGGRLGC